MAYKYKSPFERIAEAFGFKGKYRTAFKKGEFSILFDIADFTLNMNPADVKAGNVKGYRGKKFDLEKMMIGLTELERILQDRELLGRIYNIAYNTHIAPIIRVRSIGSSLERGGRGSSWIPNYGKEEKTSKEKKNSMRGPRNPRGPELGEKWDKVYALLNSSIKEISPGVWGSFSMRDLMAINMSSDNPAAKFRNVYMMAEFGTGQVATPPRRFEGRKKTPYKLWPDLRKLYGPADTSWWYVFGSTRVYAENTIKAVKQRNKMLSSGNTKGIRKVERKIDTDKVFKFIFGDKGTRSIRPRHVIFDARGMVKELRVAYARAYKTIGKLIEDELRAKVSFWPKGTISLVMNPSAMFHFDFATKKVG